jgi:hypothetical protein
VPPLARSLDRHTRADFDAINAALKVRAEAALIPPAGGMRR